MDETWKLTIAYDSEGHQGYRTGWGFSAVVSRGTRRILFDCGWDGRTLGHNLNRMGIGFSDIDAVVISHVHWDHLSGLTEVLAGHASSEGPDVFVPASFSKQLKAEISRKATLREVKGPTEVAPGIVSTGELGRTMPEQSLVLVDGGKGTVLTGCAHPGIGVILERAESIARPSCLVGGLHGAKASYLPPGLEHLALCHCTREKAAMAEAFPGKVSFGKVGDEYGPRGPRRVVGPLLGAQHV